MCKCVYSIDKNILVCWYALGVGYPDLAWINLIWYMDKGYSMVLLPWNSPFAFFLSILFFMCRQQDTFRIPLLSILRDKPLPFS